MRANHTHNAARAAVLLSSLALLTALALLPSAGAQIQPHPRETGRLFAAWLPPATYTAIVVNSNADTRDWAISLRTTRGVFPIVVPPHANVIIPFEGGWTIDARDEARLLSEHVPFADITAPNQLGEDDRLILSAWAISPNGPVPLVFREVE